MGGELEAAEGRAEGAERAAEVGVPAGDRPSGGWRWRRPAPPPDESACLEEFEPFVARWSRVLNPAFGRIPDFRKRERCAYDAGTIAWTVLLGMFLRRKSRVRMDSDRNSREYAESVLRISGQDLAQWPEGEPYHAPSSQTCCYLLRRTPSSGLLDALSGMVGAAIRSKFLDGARHRGYFLLAFDGTKQEGVWRMGGAPRAGIRYQLEAKLLGPGGIALSVASCTVKQYFDDNGKIDCELTAFKVLARRIKRRCPHRSSCAVGDALYACQPVMRICEDYGWKYVLTFKKGRTPSAYEESEALMRLVPGNAGDMSVRAKDGGRVAVGDLAWARGITLGEGKGEVSFNAVRCAEWAKGDGVSRPGVRRERINDKPPYRGCFATNFDVWDADSASDIVACGRLRWNIENNFKVEKADYGFGLEHVFCNHWRCSRNFYILMQLANNLWQLFKTGCLPRLNADPRNVAQYHWADILAQMLKFVGIKRPMDSMPTRYMRRMDL